MTPIHLLRLRQDRPWRGFLVGISLFLLAAMLRFLFGGISQGFGPMTFLPAILLGGLMGGIRIGLGIAGLCIVVGWGWFFPPYGTVTLTRSDLISMTIFIITAGLELYVIRKLAVAINDLSIARERSNTLFRELQHRVANNLQSVAAFLYLRKKNLAPDSPAAKALDGAQGRLDLMSRVHRHLNNPASVELPLGSYLEGLSTDLIAASNAPHIRVSVEAAEVEFDLETVMSLSLIVAELITNSLKHAFPGGRPGNIAIRLEAERTGYILTVADDGCGRPPERDVDTAKRGLGRRILKNLAAGLGGTIAYEDGHGTTARLIFHPDQSRVAPAQSRKRRGDRTTA